MDLLAATSPRVLIADDEAPVLFALRLLLESEGCRTEAVRSPGAAVRAVESGGFDLVLMDLNYAPGHTAGREGLNLVSLIRDADQLLPIVAMTSYATLDLVVDAMRAGVCDLILKPWQNEELVDRLRHAIGEGRRRRDAVARLSRERRDSRIVQHALLPRTLGAVPGWEIAAEWRPAGEVGGDYYDVIDLGPNRIGICIADVSGKGMPAAMLMSNLQAIVRATATAIAAPSEVCARTNRALCASTDGARFVSLFYGVLDARAGTFCWSNAGHPPPLLRGADGTHRVLGEGGIVMGLVTDWVYEQGAAAVRPGDRIVLCTDGITEAGRADREFGMNGVAAVLDGMPSLDAGAVRDAIFAEARRACGGDFHDDATLIVMVAS